MLFENAFCQSTLSVYDPLLALELGSVEADTLYCYLYVVYASPDEQQTQAASRSPTTLLDQHITTLGDDSKAGSFCSRLQATRYCQDFRLT